MRLEFNRRDESLEAGYMAMMETPCIVDRVNFTLNEFKKGCSEFDVWGFFEDEPAGMFFLDGNHPHIAILNKYHGKCGKVIKFATNLALKKHGELIADIHKDNDKAIRLVERLGFEYEKTNGDISTYRLGE